MTSALNTAKLVKRPVPGSASLAHMSGPQPKHGTTWNDYHQRILRVLAYIQEHLDEALDLEELAPVACFSNYHFHRIFAAMTGETLADHVRRLRLERAAVELRSGAKQVIPVALDAGYEAHAAFTRAFKAALGVSPRIGVHHHSRRAIRRAFSTGSSFDHIQHQPHRDKIYESRNEKHQADARGLPAACRTIRRCRPDVKRPHGTAIGGQAASQAFGVSIYRHWAR